MADGGKKGAKVAKAAPARSFKHILVPALVVLGLALCAGYLHMHVDGMLTGHSFAGATTIIWQRCLDDIRSAQQESLPWYHTSPMAGSRADMGRVAYLGMVRAIAGLNFLHPRLRSLDLSRFVWPQDEESRMCQSLLGYMWVSPMTSGFTYPSVYAGSKELKEWIRACRAEWPNLSDEERALLAPFRAQGDIPLQVLVPPPDDNDEVKTAARGKKDLPLYENAERFTREELLQILHKAIAQSAYRGKAEEPPESVVEYYSGMNMRKAVEIPGTWAEVGKAIRTGRITKFDARGLLPKELFNVSFRTMKAWEGPAAARIPIFGDGTMPASFAHFVDDKDLAVQEPAVRTSVCIADEGLSTVNGKSNGFDPAVVGQVAAQGFRPKAGYIHTRRLPEFHKKLPNIERPMGIEDDVLRGQSMLWLGATPGGFHYDEEANVYVQLTGDTFAFLVPQNWTDYFTGAIRHPWNSAGLPGLYEVEKDPKLKMVPIYLIHLQPGDGITLHGRTYHRFMAQTADRISLNWFFIPKWRRMEYTPSDWYSLEAKRSLTRLALRQLWARTISRVYDDTGLGLVYMGTKLEYI